MKALGAYHLSWDALQEAVMHGVKMIDFVPLHHSALQCKPYFYQIGPMGGS
jgi:hypothetical protein